MAAAGIKPDNVVYNSAISACQSAGRWDKVIDLLKEMPTVGLMPGRHSFVLFIESCQEAGQAELVEGLTLEGLRDTLVENEAAAAAAAATIGESFLFFSACFDVSTMV